MEIRNLTADERDIPDVGFVEPGGTIEVDDELGESLTEQADVWANVDEGGGTVKGILADVDGDPNKARQALAVERASDKPRKSLISRLEEIANDEEQG